MQYTALASLEKRNKLMNSLPQSLSPITHQQILLSRIRLEQRQRQRQHLLKADLHPNKIYGTSLPVLMRRMKLNKSGETTKSSTLVKGQLLLEPIKLSNMHPLKLMRRGKPSKLIQNNVPEFRLSPPAIPFEDDNKRERSLFKPI